MRSAKGCIGAERNIYTCSTPSPYHAYKKPICVQNKSDYRLSLMHWPMHYIAEYAAHTPRTQGKYRRPE